MSNNTQKNTQKKTIKFTYKFKNINDIINNKTINQFINAINFMLLNYNEIINIKRTNNQAQQNQALQNQAQQYQDINMLIKENYILFFNTITQQQNTNKTSNFLNKNTINKYFVQQLNKYIETFNNALNTFLTMLLKNPTPEKHILSNKNINYYYNYVYNVYLIITSIYSNYIDDTKYNPENIKKKDLFDILNKIKSQITNKIKEEEKEEEKGLQAYKLQQTFNATNTIMPLFIY